MLNFGRFVPLVTFSKSGSQPPDAEADNTAATNGAHANGVVKELESAGFKVVPDHGWGARSQDQGGEVSLPGDGEPSGAIGRLTLVVLEGMRGRPLSVRPARRRD
jgi:hypothetical protein